MKTLWQVVVILLALAAAGILATVAHILTGTDVFGIVSVLAGATALAGGLALSVTPTNLYPHLVLIAAVIGLTVAMGLTHIFVRADVVGVFGDIFGAGLLGAGANAITKVLAPKGEHQKK